MRRTADGSSTVSSRTCWNDPDSSSAKVERDECALSNDFGVTTMRGRLGLASPWERNRWKYCADVEGTVTRMLPRAPSDRKLSKRAEECSGPCPSYPCGSNRTSPAN